MSGNINKKITLPKPLPYQLDIINWLDNNEVKFVSFKKSRQSGGSWLNKWLLTKWALENNNIKIGYVTPTLKLSKLFFRELVESLKPFITDSNSTDLLIKFKTGSNIQFFSAESGDSLRGFQFHYCILDEAAFMSDDVFNLIIRPTFLITGRKIIMCSTPNGSQGFFFNYCQYGLEELTGYRTKEISIYDNPFISREDIALIKSQIPSKVFEQEFEGKFLDGAGTVFTNFKNCINEHPTLNNNYYAAIDWGKGDYTVLTIINDKREVVYIYRINGMEYTTQVKLIAEKLRQWKPITTISEENNIGTVVNELLKKEYSGRIHTITLDNTFKKDMIEQLVVAFEQQLIGIPNDDNLLRELQAFSCQYNPQTQTVKYNAPSGLHDDMVISLAYAYYAINNMRKGLNVSFINKKSNNPNMPW